jgi:hypothetical protein
VNVKKLSVPKDQFREAGTIKQFAQRRSHARKLSTKADPTQMDLIHDDCCFSLCKKDLQQKPEQSATAETSKE